MAKMNTNTEIPKENLTEQGNLPDSQEHPEDVKEQKNPQKIAEEALKKILEKTSDEQKLPQLRALADHLQELNSTDKPRDAGLLTIEGKVLDILNTLLEKDLQRFKTQDSLLALRNQIDTQKNK